MSFCGVIGDIMEIRKRAGAFSCEWTITDLSSLSDEGGDYYQSPLFDSCFGQWGLVIYPGGLSRNPPSKWANVFLCRNDAGPPRTVSVTVGVRGPHGVENKRERLQEFSTDDPACYWRGFCQKSVLSDPQSKLTPGNVLTLTCEMKNVMPSGRIDQQSSDRCVMCCEEPVDCALYRCGHACMCYDCASKLWKSNSSAQCPICRNCVRDVLKIYK